MKTTTEIVRIAPYGVIHIWCEKHQCRHPIDKPCDAKIEAYRLEFEAEVKEKERQRKKRSREKINRINNGVQDATVENIGESLEDDPEASAEAMKAQFAEDEEDEEDESDIETSDIEEIDQTKQPPRAEVAKLVRAWVEASPEAKREFVRERWDEIAVARKQLDANGADHEDRWIEGDR